MSKKWFSSRPSTHGTRFPYCAEASPGSSWIFLQIHAGIAMLKPPRPDDVFHGIYHHPQAQTKLPGPFRHLPVVSDHKWAFGQVLLHILDLECARPSHSWSLHCGFVTFFWIFLPPILGSLRAPETFQIQAKKHFVDPAQSGIMRPPHRATPTFSDHHPSRHLSSTSHCNKWVATLGFPQWLCESNSTLQQPLAKSLC